MTITDDLLDLSWERQRSRICEAIRRVAEGAGTKDPKDIELEPEVEAFVSWFADWWLRRGARLYADAKKAHPDRLERGALDENAVPLRWDEETVRLVLDSEAEPEDAADPPRPRRRSHLSSR